MNDEEMNQRTAELVGVLQAISVVAKKLAHRLMRIEEEVKRREKKLSAEFVSKKY
ncbi:MAG: hypothetical protein ABRQ25_12710 [Clostridiaceae bacterium]